jgi:hypothetical protein
MHLGTTGIEGSDLRVIKVGTGGQEYRSNLDTHWYNETMALINRGRNTPKPQLKGDLPYKPLTRSLHDRLMTYAQEHSTNKWMVIEQAVEEFLNRHEVCK